MWHKTTLTSFCKSYANQLSLTQDFYKVTSNLIHQIVATIRWIIPWAASENYIPEKFTLDYARQSHISNMLADLIQNSL